MDKQDRKEAKEVQQEFIGREQTFQNKTGNQSQTTRQKNGEWKQKDRKLRVKHKNLNNQQDSKTPNIIELSYAIKDTHTHITKTVQQY